MTTIMKLMALMIKKFYQTPWHFPKLWYNIGV